MARRTMLCKRGPTVCITLQKQYFVIILIVITQRIATMVYYIQHCYFSGLCPPLNSKTKTTFRELALLPSSGKNNVLCWVLWNGLIPVPGRLLKRGVLLQNLTDEVQERRNVELYSLLRSTCEGLTPKLCMPY
jgi:hypothetical protein